MELYRMDLITCTQLKFVNQHKNRLISWFPSDWPLCGNYFVYTSDSWWICILIESSNERHSRRFDYIFPTKFEWNSKSAPAVWLYLSVVQCCFVASLHDNQTWCDWSNCKYPRFWLIERLILQLAKIKCVFKLEIEMLAYDWLDSILSVRWLFFYIYWQWI